MKMVPYGIAAGILLSGAFFGSCTSGELFTGGRCEVNSDCNSWSQQAEGTICVSGRCVCADPDKHVGCAPGEDGCRPACIPAECSDLCLALPPTEWSPPLLVWTGAPNDAPGCPEAAPFERYRGLASPSGEALDCPACECDDVVTTCEIPTQWTASTTACNNPGGSTLPFAAPAGWDGSCTSAGAIAGGIASLSVPATTVTTAAECVSNVGAIPDPSPMKWGAAAVACELPGYPRCGTGFCVPPPIEAWQACVLREGDNACPDGYPTRSVFYDEADDTRACAPCACGAPSGGGCTVLAQAYADGACSGQPIFSSATDSSSSACSGLLANMSLGSKSATVLDVVPATCAPAGGAPTGSVMPAGPTTICCAG